VPARRQGRVDRLHHPGRQRRPDRFGDQPVHQVDYVVYQITVDPETTEWAKVGLQRMLEII
jgi:hypothetical protein